jgi:hypothetical protein
MRSPECSHVWVFSAAPLDQVVAAPRGFQSGSIEFAVIVHFHIKISSLRLPGLDV